MRSSAPYTRATLRGIRRRRGPNSTSAPPSHAVNTNAESLRPRRQPSPQLADIPSASRTKTSKEEKVDIVKDLLRQWGWSFYRLVSEYFESENGHRGNRKKKKVGDLLVPLLEDKEIQEELVDRADIHTTLITCAVRCIRKELRQLQLQRGPFNTWTPDIEFQDIDLENTAKFVQQHGPLLFQLIEGISAPNREERSRDPHGGRTVIVASIFLLGFARNSANGFARLLGLHLQALGVKRRVLSFLHGLGLIDGYKTLNAKKLGLAERSKKLIKSLSIHDDVCIVYDNFDYCQKTRHQVIGEISEFNSHTTGKILRGVCMPEGGLKQSMLNNTRQLKLDEVVNAAGNKFDDLQKRISTSFIADAIRCAYPTAVDGIFDSDADIEYPRIPAVDVLPHGRTEHVTLGPILDSEASINGNYRVMENIFLDQLQYNRETAFNDRLFLVYGDQKTAKLIRSCKEERVEAEGAYDSHKWVLPIPGLWHVRLNFLYMVMRTFYGGEEAAQQFSALYPHINHLGRRNIPREKAPFHHMEELILQSFDARIVALFLLHIRDKCNIEADGEAERYVRNLSPQQFLEHVEDIRTAAFSRDVCRDANQRTSDHSEPPANARQPAATSSSADTSSSAADNHDTEFFNHIRFLQVIDTYKLLKYAIKHADIGLLKRVIPRLCLYFAGSSSKNYAYDMLILWRLVGTSACDPVLQRAILANSLVNLRGRPDSFFETDRLNELLNLQLKELLWTRGNSTFGMDELFKWSVLTISYTGALRDIFERAFGERTNSEHTTKSPALDIRYLADQIRKDSIVRYTRRSADFEAPSLLQRGYEKLAKDGVNTFNAFLLTAAGLPFNPLTCSFGDADENIEVLGEAAEYIHMSVYELLDEC